jgi:hypothetical protein
MMTKSTTAKTNNIVALGGIVAITAAEMTGRQHRGIGALALTVTDLIIEHKCKKCGRGDSD